MDWSQWAYLLALAAALGTGRPGNMVAAAMAFNLTGTVLFAGDLMGVAVLDLMTAGLLIGEGKRANFVALIFVAMQPVYLAGHYLGLKSAAVYALIDVLAYIQLGVIGGWDVGLRNLLRRAGRHLDGRHWRSDTPAISRGHVSRDGRGIS